MKRHGTRGTRGRFTKRRCNTDDDVTSNTHVKSSPSETQRDGRVVVLECRNCHRQDAFDWSFLSHVKTIEEETLRRVYRLDITIVTFLKKSLRRKFATFGFAEVSRRRGDVVRVPLCSCCAAYLLDETGMHNKTMKYGWPGFIWKLISDGKALDEHGAKLWSVIPRCWRFWWLESVRRLLPEMGFVTIEEPVPFVTDVTWQKLDFEAVLNRLEIAEIVPKVDEYLLPLVKCPWGCSEFLHKTGCIGLECVLCRCLGPTGITFGCAPIDAAKKLHHEVYGVRNDFLREPGYVDYYLENPEWIVMPSICFVDMVPVFLTCRYHKHGSSLAYVHAPDCPVTKIPPPRGDQIAPAVVRPRMIKQARIHEFSTTYCMQEMRGGFAGVDTIRLGDFGKFDFISSLTREKESLVLQGRSDVRNLVSMWMRPGGRLDPMIGRELLDNAQNDFPQIAAFDRFLMGATYMLLVDSITLYSERQMSVLRCATRYDGHTLYYREAWPRHLAYVHSCDLHGCEQPKVKSPPSDGNSTYEQLWLLMVMMSQVAELWSAIDTEVAAISDWKGWALCYCANKIGVPPFVVSGRSRRNRSRTFPFSFEREKRRRKKKCLQTDSEEAILLHILASCCNGQACDWDTEDCYGDEEEDAGIDLDIGSVNNNCAASRRSSELEGSENDGDSDSSCSYEASTGIVQCDRTPLRADYERLFNTCCFEMNSVLPLFDGNRVGGVTCVLTSEMERLGGILCPSVSVLVVGRDLQDFMLASDFASCDGGGLWVLRCVIALSPKRGGSYLGLCYSRHSKGVFSSWWAQDTCASFVHKVPSDRSIWDDDILCMYWCVAVYVKEMQPDIEVLRNQYLSAMGGQSALYCLQHNVPLVTLAPQKKGLRCCGHKSPPFCSSCPVLTCPFWDCDCSLCRDHFSSLSVTKGKVKLGVPDFSLENTSTCGVKESDVQNADVDSDDGGDISDNLSECSLFTDIEEKSDVSDCSSLGDRVGECDSDDSTESGCSVDTVVPGDWQAVVTEPFDDGLVSSGESSDDDSQIPTTNAGSAPRDCFVFRSGEELHTIRSHVVMNNCGSCLIRKRNKISATKPERNFLERIVSVDGNTTVPLVYPEAVMFPSVFWRQLDQVGSVVGAIPSIMLTDDDTNRRRGFASVIDQLRVRLTNPSCLTMMEKNYLSYAFDAKVNISCRGTDTRIMLHRGTPREVQTGIRAIDGLEPPSMFNSESVDSRPVVNQLAAALASNKGHVYFFTTSANQKHHFGLRRLRAWLDNRPVLEDADARFRGPDGNWNRNRYDLETELWETRQLASVIPMMRNWTETLEILMKYITNSHEEPLGPIGDAWWRKEFQDSQANLSHLHALLFLKQLPGASAEETLAQVQERISGSIMNLIRLEDMPDLLEKGLLENSGSAFTQLIDLATKFLRHRCDATGRCKMRIGSDDGGSTLKCRVANNGYDNPCPWRHYMKEIKTVHSAVAERILLTLGLLLPGPPDCDPVPTCEGLKMVKHIPPAVAGEGKISSCNGSLFATLRSNQNVKLNTGYNSSRYLAKYVAGIDESNCVYVGASPHSSTGLVLDKQKLYNTKITGSKMQEAKVHNARRNKNHPTGRLIGLAEMAEYVLGNHQIHTTFEFEHIPTTPYAERPAVERKPPIRSIAQFGNIPGVRRARSIDDLSSQSVLPQFKVRNVLLRNDLPLWRKLGDTDTMVQRDQLLSPLSLDKITIFSLRPPELRFIRNPSLYFRWFYRSKSHVISSPGNIAKMVEAILEYTDPLFLERTTWIDATGRIVYLRPRAIDEVISYIGDRRDSDFYAWDHPLDGRVIGAQLSTLQLFQHKIRPSIFVLPLARSVRRREECESIRWRFLHVKSNLEGGALIDHMEQSEKKCKLPIIWFTSVKPTNPSRWLIHLLLSMGEYDNELQLFGHANLRECFIGAKMLSPIPEDWDSGINDIARSYVTQQLMSLPGGTKQFDRNVIAAYQALRSSVLHDRIECNEMPSVLYTHTQLEASEKQTKHLRETKEKLARIVLTDLRNKGFTDLPPYDELIPPSTTVIDPESRSAYRHQFVPIGSQSRASVLEQQGVYDQALHLVDEYQSPSKTHTPKNLNVVGGPGVGKTTLMQLVCLAIIYRQLTTIITSVNSERAQELGGDHIASVWCIPVNESVNSIRLAELSIARLLRNPAKLLFLMRLDIALLDEFGQLSVEMLNTMDIISRRVRGSDQFMGGIQFINTIDNNQLQPVHGTPPLVSPHILTSFTFLLLKESVRACTDPDLQEIQSFFRKPPAYITDLDRIRFRWLIENKCTHVKSFDDDKITPTMFRVFGKHQARRIAIQHMITKISRIYGDTVVVRESVDVESSLEGHWTAASKLVRKVLSRKIREPQKLRFYPWAPYNITFNKPGHFSQGQLCLLLQVPTLEELDHFTPVKVLLAPEGCKIVPQPNKCDMENLVHSGWRFETVGQAPEHIQLVLGGVQARRTQYGLSHRYSGTAHAVQGQTLDWIVTRVTDPSENLAYAIWERAQALVLLSRTHYASHIIFVGEPTRTSEALANLLTKRSLYSDYITYLLHKLCGDSLTGSPPDRYIQQHHHPIAIPQIEIPQTSSGYAYLLVSTQDPLTSYIGQSDNLIRRFKEHNRGFGAKSTAPEHLRPWALFGYVTGFDDGVDKGKSDRIDFEDAWQLARTNRERKYTTAPADILGIARQLARRWSTEAKPLTVIDCRGPSEPIPPLI